MELDNHQVLALLKRVADRDERAFARLYASVSRRVYAFAMHRLGDATAASEIVSETLYQVWRAPTAFRGDAKFSTWLLAVIPALRRAQDKPGFARAGIQHRWHSVDSRLRGNDGATGVSPRTPAPHTGLECPQAAGFRQ